MTTEKEMNEIFARNERSTEQITMTINRYRLNGKPVCLSWWGSKKHPRQACQFYGTSHFGTRSACLYLGVTTWPDTIPGKCPVWKDESNNKGNDMEELFEKLNDKVAEFQAQARKAINGNKSAGARSRKLSLEISALMKQWRTVSNPDSMREA